MGGSQIEAVNSNSQWQGTAARIANAFTHTRIVAWLLLFGVGLRVWAYARDTSLYLDEILLTRNILDLPLQRLLTKPLALDQVAPRGFLLVERLVVGIFGPSELALRLFRGTPRLWVLAGPSRPLIPVRTAVLKYLGTIGVRRDVKAFPSLLYGSITLALYDLTDPAHLAAATAENFPVPAMPRDPRIGCREWTTPNYDWELVK